jgi:secretion/DNA translocation related TadE-like protein
VSGETLRGPGRRRGCGRGPEGERWRGCGRDRGAASILLLAVGLALIAMGLAGASVGTARVGRHQAQSAADLAALAGAADAVHGQTAACGRAAELAEANGGQMTWCMVDGLEIVVWAEVEVRPMPGMVRHAEGGARAGPIYAVAE